MSYEKEMETFIGDDEVTVYIEYEYLPSFDRLNCFYYYILDDKGVMIPTGDIHTKTKNRIESEIQDLLDEEFSITGQHHINEYNDNSDELYDDYRESKC